MNDFGDGNFEKARAINNLRDILATLKWEIWESEPTQQRGAIIGNEWDEFVDKRLNEWPYFDLDYIDGMVFKQKGISNYSEAFAHLNYLNPNRSTAFLFDKRNHN